MIRTCVRCGEGKALHQFYVRSTGRRETRCRACVTESSRQWRLNNPDRYRVLERDLARSHAVENGLALAARRCKYNAVQRGAAVIDEIVPLVLLERHDGVCGICGEDVDPLKFEVDHVVAILDGGEHSYANAQPVHPYCNLVKGVRERDARKAVA